MKRWKIYWNGKNQEEILELNNIVEMRNLIDMLNNRLERRKKEKRRECLGRSVKCKIALKI